MNGNLDIFKDAPSLLKVSDKDTAIEFSHVTKDYGKNRGIFDINLNISFIR